MITSEGKCDGKCATCNLMQQTYCRLVQFRTEQDSKLCSRLEHIEDAIVALDNRLNSEIIAQGGSGALVPKAPESAI